MVRSDIVLDIFSKQVGEKPTSPALRQKHKVLTYEQLDQLSNGLANYLIKEGIKPGTLVPICLRQPIDTVICIWGILKTGAAYVPIDAEFPVERMAFMIKDTGANFVISDTHCSNFLTAAEGRTCLLADNDWIEIAPESVASVNIEISPDDLAYVIYTSGSTGKPKGVMIEHKSITDYIVGLFERVPYRNCKTFALGVSFAADSVITHLFGSAALGAELHLFTKEDYNNPEYIHNYFAEHHIDCLKVVPSHWKSLSYNGKELLPDKILMFGGEALYTAVIRDIIPTASGCILINHYGPTETTVGQLLHVIKENEKYGHTIPIGKTFTDAYEFILDADGNEVPDGNEGVLYIGGTCLARGYLNRPELTTQRFVTGKCITRPEARMYCTGDLVRRLPDGDIEFIGREDDQVKISGFRIELGEIENVLQNAPGVKQNVVLTQIGASGDKRLVGYVVCPDGYDKMAIIQYLEQKLPAHMIPQLLVLMPDLPFFPNGKVDKRALPNPDASTLLTNAYNAPSNSTQVWVAEIWKSLLCVERVGIDDNFFELGGTSLLAIKTVSLLKSRYSLTLPIVKLFQFPRVRDLAAYLDGKTEIRKAENPRRATGGDVAVISMAGRFPGADSIEEFWNLLKNGKETTTFFKDNELDSNISPALTSHPNYVKARGIINDVKGFDAAFFGITPRMAELMDPQHRLFMEVAWEALERGGYSPGKYDGAIGVFAGVRFNTYYANNVQPNDELIETLGRFQVLTLNDKDYVASRTAYSLDLKGPAINVQSACSTSLLAVAQAVQSIRNGQCDMALAGGATVTAPVNIGHLYEEGAMLTNDGHCRPFDADARGTVFSDGAGAVLLKSMDCAIRDGDNIVAVIKGIGLSNDGGDKGSFTAPSAEGQAAAIRQAIDDAGVAPTDISYIEAHGTGTPLGDPIEIEGLNMAFGALEVNQFCAIGSVKSNFGHLTAAAGITGFIKTCLALQHKQIPPSINFKSPNPHIDFENSPFFVNEALRAWDGVSDRIAGVSSFGVGGTNVHIVVSGFENPDKVTGKSRPSQLICWSAKSENSVELYRSKLARYLDGLPESELADAAYTLHTAREDFDYRRFAVLSPNGGFASQTIAQSLKVGATRHTKDKAKGVVFMFPGQGDQYLNMGLSLYNTEIVFRNAMDECAGILIDELKENILDIIYPKTISNEASDKLKNTEYSQPALFSIGYALGKLWMSWGIYPSAFVGHSIGEFVAAYFSGVFSLQDAFRLIANRGRMMASLPGGSMLSVRLGVAEIEQHLSDEIALAAANGPKLSVVAGTHNAIEQLITTLNEREIPNRILATSHAFHSHMMDVVIAPFEAVVRKTKLRKPGIPVMSTVTGQWLTGEEATDPGYWAKHLRSPVLFGTAVQNLISESHDLFLELGPGKSVATLTRQQAAGKAITAISSIEKTDEEQPSGHSILVALGNLWQAGVSPDWKGFYHDEPRIRKTGIPTYAFDKQNYRVEPPARVATLHINRPEQQSLQTPAPAIGENKSMAAKPELISKIREILENSSGIDAKDVPLGMSFIEAGFDSLLLTNVALLLSKRFGLRITFRQLNNELGTLETLTDYLNSRLPENRPTSEQNPPRANPAVVSTALSPEDENELRKPFGAAARIEKKSAALTGPQQKFLADLIERYNAKTKASKEYTQKNRAHMADPRVVSGFNPAIKELVYSIVMNRSQGCRLWDIDGNEYIDSLNGFGSNLLGYQPDVLKDALIAQIEKGYEIGPQHELAGEVCELICEFTGFERSALCNTGSEAVLGAMRIARTVTGRPLIVTFAGSYHGITDEVIVRGSKNLKTYPASPGIMPEAVSNMLVLEYGTEKALQIIELRAGEIAAVLVEPVQSRRCDFQPIDFLKKLRALTSSTNTVLIFDEVISGFRFHPGGVQAMFGIKADLGTYGKVVGGGLSIGIIAGGPQYMDALDGGSWQYGDDSIPEVGVTYFAGTFVRHPLALAAAKASLEYLRRMGPNLQEDLNAKAHYVATALNAACRRLRAPIFIAQFGSLWRVRFLTDYPYQGLLFVLMRYKGIHIVEGFPCFLTTAHTDADIACIIESFETSVSELREAGMIPDFELPAIEKLKTLNIPPLPNARLGKDREGNPAWFIADENNQKQYLQVIL